MLTNRVVTDLIRQALSEDLGHGDITSEATIPAESTSEAVILAKQHLVLAGIDIAREVFRHLDPGIQFALLQRTAMSYAPARNWHACRAIPGACWQASGSR